VATYNLRRFSQPDALKAIGHEHLIAFLNPHAKFLTKRGFMLPPSGHDDGLDYEGLANILMTPDSDIPNDLVDALYFVHEMATAEGMDELLKEVEHNGNSIQLADNPDPTPADVAIQVWLQDKDLLQRKHSEQYLTRRRSFTYFQTDKSPLPPFKEPTREILDALQSDLDDWFEKKKRGRTSRVFVYPKGKEIWFLVRHGDPYKRDGSIDAGQSSSVFYRPEKYDVLVYDSSLGELRINAKPESKKELYRGKFGLHLFGDEDFFPGENKYTLKPLQIAGAASIVCTDIKGMDWVKLKEVHFSWGGEEHEFEIRKADDVFTALQNRNDSMPNKARITRASFLVKFSDYKTPRTVIIRPSNVAEYQHDDDSTVVEDWLMKRGFIVTANQENSDSDEEFANVAEETTPAPMVSA
jgi:hypothetical protein